MTSGGDEDDLLDLNLSHEPAMQTLPESQSLSASGAIGGKASAPGLYPAFQSIDDVAVNNAYGASNAYDEHAPMLGQMSPKGTDSGKMDSNAPISVTVNASQASANSPKATSYTETNAAANNPNPNSAKCWQIEYYRPYFNVDTMSLMTRLKRSMIPLSPFLDAELNEQPDLYGPFWIVSTLVFLMAAMGNLSRFLNRETTNTSEWENDIKKISEAASMLYSVSAFLPLILYFLFRNWNAERGFIELTAIYGYSLFPFIPACMLCVVPWELFQWAIVFVGFGISVWFLGKNLYAPLAEEQRGKPGYYVLGIVIIVQFAISLALKIYFFQY